MRRRPHEDDEEQDEALEADRAGGRRPADHRRHGAGCSADHDVLRRPALEPHGVDEHVEADGEREQAGRHPVQHQAHAEHGAHGENCAEGARLVGADPAFRHRPPRGPRHARVDIGVVPHVQRTSGAGADGNADERGDGEHRVHVSRRGDEPDERGEHHEEHHPRLHQREIFGDLTAFGGGQDLRACVETGFGHALLTQEWRRSRALLRPATAPM